jgi:hypothetical protein
MILSHVYGSVINNSGFWIGWLDLLTPLQSLSVTTAHNHWLPKTRSVLAGLRLSSVLVSYCNGLCTDLRIIHFCFTNELRMAKEEGRITYEWILLYEWMTNHSSCTKANIRSLAYPTKCLFNVRLHGNLCFNWVGLQKFTFVETCFS